MRNIRRIWPDRRDIKGFEHFSWDKLIRLSMHMHIETSKGGRKKGIKWRYLDQLDNP